MHPCCCDPVCDFPITEKVFIHGDTRLRQYHLVIVEIVWRNDAACLIRNGGEIPSCPAAGGEKSVFACQVSKAFGTEWEWTRLTEAFNGKTQYTVKVIATAPAPDGTYIASSTILRVELGTGGKTILRDALSGRGRISGFGDCPISVTIDEEYRSYRKPWDNENPITVILYNVAPELSDPCPNCDDAVYGVFNRNYVTPHFGTKAATFCDANYDGLDRLPRWSLDDTTDDGTITLNGTVHTKDRRSVTLNGGVTNVLDRRPEDIIIGALTVTFDLRFGVSTTRSEIKYDLRLIDNQSGFGSFPGPGTNWRVTSKHVRHFGNPTCDCPKLFPARNGIGNVLFVSI